MARNKEEMRKMRIIAIQNAKERACKECNIIFKPQGAVNQVYCSLECRSIAINKQQKTYYIKQKKRLYGKKYYRLKLKKQKEKEIVCNMELEKRPIIKNVINYCPNCGFKLHNTNYCPNCGNKIK